jgi:hypothetical protein
MCKHYAKGRAGENGLGKEGNSMIIKACWNLICKLKKAHVSKAVGDRVKPARNPAKSTLVCTEIWDELQAG